MLAKITSKNQLTLPKAAVEAVGQSEYFDVEVRGGQIVLTPVRMQRGDAVRAKLAELGLGQADIADAIRWARKAIPAQAVSEPAAPYRSEKPRKHATAKVARKRTVRSK